MLDVNIFDSMRIGLASPDKFFARWSLGEVIKKPETINQQPIFFALTGSCRVPLRIVPTRDLDTNANNRVRL